MELYIFKSSSGSVREQLRAPKALKLLRLSKIAKIIRIAKLSRASRLMQAWRDRFEDHFHIQVTKKTILVHVCVRKKNRKKVR